MSKSAPRGKMKTPFNPIMVKVKFLASCDDGKFKAGSIHELRADSAHRWIRRGLAEKCKEPAKRKVGRPPKKKEEAKEPEKKIANYLELPSSAPITITDPTPEIEKENHTVYPYPGKEE